LAAGAIENNVATEEAEPRSMLSFYQRLITLRKREAALAAGAYRLREVTDETLVFERRLDDRCLAVALNLADTPQRVALREQRELLISTDFDRHSGVGAEIQILAAFEGIVIATAS
jgi:alpha-glucosidase